MARLGLALQNAVKNCHFSWLSHSMHTKTFRRSGKKSAFAWPWLRSCGGFSRRARYYVDYFLFVCVCLCAGAGAILYFIWPVVSSLPRVSQVSNCAINFSVGFCICSTWPNVYYFAGDFSDLFCRDKSLRQCACAKGPHSIIINNTSTTTNSIINSSSTSALLHCMAMHNNKRIVGMKWQKAVVHFHHSRWKRENDQKMCMFKWIERRKKEHTHR